MTALSKTGERMLAEAEAVIERGLATFLQVGDALSKIRDGKLYRADFDTFESYCLDRWKFTPRRANQLMDAAQIGTMVPIQNERQGRSLAPLKGDPEQVRQAYEQAEQRGDTTAAGLATVVHEITTTEKTTTTVDLETGEIVEGGDETGAGEVVPEESATPPPSTAPPVDPTLGYRARATAERSKVRDGLLTLDAARVMETTDDPKAWLDFIADADRWLSELRHQINDVPSLRIVGGN